MSSTMTITMSSAYSPTFLSLHLCHSSFSNPSITSPMSQLILQPFRCFSYVTAHSPTLPLLLLCHSSFSNPSFAFPTSQALCLCHLASRPCNNSYLTKCDGCRDKRVPTVCEDYCTQCNTVCTLLVYY